MKRYYIFENVDVMEIGKPVSNWKYNKGVYERKTMDYLINEKGERIKSVKMINTKKVDENLIIEGNYETYQEAFKALNEFWDAYLCACNK